MTAAEVRDQASDTHKHCSRCGRYLPTTEYPPDSRGLLGRASACRSCWRVYVNARNQREPVKAKRRAFDRTPERRQRTRLAYVKRTYGERGVELERRRVAGETCDGCGLRAGVAIDHSHQSGESRGLLCRHCNLILGYAEDDAGVLDRLAAYLRR